MLDRVSRMSRCDTTMPSPQHLLNLMHTSVRHNCNNSHIPHHVASQRMSQQLRCLAIDGDKMSTSPLHIPPPLSLGIRLHKSAWCVCVFAYRPNVPLAKNVPDPLRRLDKLTGDRWNLYCERRRVLHFVEGFHGCSGKHLSFAQHSAQHSKYPFARVDACERRIECVDAMTSHTSVKVAQETSSMLTCASKLIGCKCKRRLSSK